MDTQDIVERWRSEAIQEGVRQGLELGVAQSLIAVYESRLGAMPPELRAAVAATHDEPTLRAWLMLAATRSADEIRAAIQAPRAS